MSGPVKTADYDARRRAESMIENLPDWALKQLADEITQNIAIIQRDARESVDQVRRLKKRKARIIEEQTRRRGAGKP